jgi:Rad3-related DNA helicase
MGIIDDIDEDSYVHSVFETVLEFKDFLDESFVRYRDEERGKVVDIVSVNLAKKFEELVNKNNALVLMSGTIHSESALRDIFGIENYEVVDAEVINQGEIIVKELGMERDCSYRNLQNGMVSREWYLKALNRIVSESVKPALVHVNAFNDLPSEDEKYSFDLTSLMTKNRLKELQKKGNEQVERFKRKEIPVLFTTRCNRGVDFPGDQCKSIIFTKYPNPAAQDLFWQILRRVHPEHYWSFYKDKASREFLQKIYRGVRSKEDHVHLYSPDLRVLDAGKMLISEEIIG